LGGTQAIVHLISLVKNKIVAVLLGPGGLGLVGLYMSATAVVSVAASLGLNSSGVREIAEAHAKNDAVSLARTVVVLRRLCWLLGCAGWLATMALAWPLSLWTFGSAERTLDIAILGSTVMLTVIGGGQVALLQGMRRIADLAQINFLCVAAATVISLILYAFGGLRAIVPTLILSVLANLFINWLFVRRVELPSYSLTWRETFRSAGPLLRLGVALMWNGLLVTSVALATRALIVRQLGIDESGLYQAAWTISGMFSGFVLAAMSTDFYPRLAGVAADNAALRRLVNEQTEVGLLLALPGILGTLVFAPALLELLYTSKFVPAADLLPWFLAGVFIQVISWPIGFILLAKSHSFTFAWVETVINASQVVLLLIALRSFGLVGASLAFCATQIIHICIYFYIVNREAEFAWAPAVFKLVGSGAAFMTSALALHYFAHSWPRLVAGVLMVAASSCFSVRRLLPMVGPSSRVGRIIWRLPFIHWLAPQTTRVV